MCPRMGDSASRSPGVLSTRRPSLLDRIYWFWRTLRDWLGQRPWFNHGGNDQGGNPHPRFAEVKATAHHSPADSSPAPAVPAKPAVPAIAAVPASVVPMPSQSPQRLSPLIAAETEDIRDLHIYFLLPTFP